MQDGDLETVAVYNRMVQAMYTAYGSTPNGTAATANVTTSATDTTAGRLLKVGDFGLGSSSRQFVGDLAAITVTGTVHTTPSTTDTGAGGALPYLGIACSVTTNIFDVNAMQQQAYIYSFDKMYIRRKYGSVWKAWQEIYHTGSICTDFTSTGIDDNATSTAITIDAGESVGIGTTNPAQKLHVQSATSGVIARVSGPNAYSAESGLEFSVGRAKISGVLSSVGGTPGSSLQFFTMPDNGAVTERMRIAGLGDITVSTGNLVIGTSGKGIDFSAASGSAAGSTSSVLDDYEEGTWTPTLGGTSTYTTQSGVYTKVGNVVTVRYEFNVNLIGTGSTTTISGLPFFAGTAKGGAAAISFFSALAMSVVNLGFRVDSGGNSIVNFIQTTAAGSVTNSQPIYKNASMDIASMTYHV